MNRKDQLSKWECIKFPVPLQQSDLEAAYSKGVLKKDQLEDGQYYLGYCRNAYVAKWVESENAFYYMRKKFKDVFPEKIFHPEDDNERDLFIPFKKVEPTKEEKIKEGKNFSFVLHRK